MIQLFEEYFKETIISNRRELFDAINLISPLLPDGWGVSNPLPGNKIMCYVPLKARKEAYKEFTIPKKSGGVRKISAPVASLKIIQSTINILLQSVFTPSDYATGFVIGKSVKDNALTHVGQLCIFNMDLENFFPSITKRMVRKALHRELGHVLASNDVINIICSLCTQPNSEGIEVLPQGAPTSPVLSNIVLKSFDFDMADLARKAGLRYSRYADDITFSHSNLIRRMSPFWIQQIHKVVNKYGLKINDAKTKEQPLGTRQEVTGVIVSNRINVPRQYLKNLRTLLHLWEKYGYEQAQSIYTKDFCKGKVKNLSSVIDGKINYLEMLKGRGDSTYRKLKYRHKKLLRIEKLKAQQNKEQRR